MRTLCTLAFAIVALPFLMGADVYRWVAADGVVNFTQQKPEGVDSTRLRADMGQHRDAPVAAPAAEPSAVAEAPEDRLSLLAKLQAAEVARQQEVTRARETNCETSRAVLNRLQGNGRIRVRGDDGAQRVMTEEERQERIAEAQRGIVSNCASTASRG